MHINYSLSLISFGFWGIQTDTHTVKQYTLYCDVTVRYCAKTRV